MEKKEGEELAKLNHPLPEGRDELNLAEFPLCSISDRVDPRQKTLTFEDRIWDDQRGQMITRRLTITGADQYGLPTASDDEVLLGLIQLSKFQGFTERHVHFTRYQLIQLLGWRNEGRSYARIERSLNRWIGVTLYYQNAWRDRANQRWVNEKFHILDNVTLLNREDALVQSDLHLSSYVWNEVIYRSFQAGNVKSLDFSFFRQLDGSIAKRLFRFLDKRFFHKRSLEFDLKELAWEHIGLSRNYDAAGIKRKLRPAIAELERHGYLQAIPDPTRFRQSQCGQWRVGFQRPEGATARGGGSLTAEQRSLVETLCARQVTPVSARDLVTRYPADQICAQLKVFDWLVAQKDPKVSRNPPGFLVTAIRGEFLPPKGFVSPEELERRQREAAERKRRLDERRRQKEDREREQAQAREWAIADFWARCSEHERLRLEAEALKGADPFARNLALGEGSLAATSRKNILNAYALSLLRIAD